MTGSRPNVSAPDGAWRATILLGLGDAINYGDRAIMPVLLPLLQQDLGLSDFSLGLLGSLFLWTYAIGSSVAGYAADRYSRRRLALGSLAIWSAITGATGSAGGLATLGMLRVALGMAECFYLPAAIALVGDFHPPRSRARAMNVLNASERLGIVAIGTLAGAIGQHHGWRAVFWILGLAGIAVAAIARPFISDPPVAATESAGPGFGEAIAFLARIPAYWMMVAKVILVGVAVWIFFTWLPYYFHESFHLNLASAGLAGTFPLQIAGVLGLAFGSWVSDRVAMRTTLRNRLLIDGLAYVAAAPILLVFAIRPSVAAVTLALLAFGCVRSFGDANEQAIVCEIVPSRYRSTAFGLMNMSATAAGGLGVLVSGLVKPALGLSAIFAGTSVLIALSAAALLAGYGVYREHPSSF